MGAPVAWPAFQLERDMYFVADAIFRTTADGGRSTPPVDGYRGSVRINSQLQSSCEFFFDADVALGIAVLTIVRPMFPEYISDQIRLGDTLDVLEGSRTVGSLVVRFRSAQRLQSAKDGDHEHIEFGN